MAHDLAELKKKTLAELREIAKELDHEAVQGYTQMNKEHLLPAVCRALGIDSHEHHVATGAMKFEARAKMREIKKLRAEALASGDHHRLRALRRQYHHLNHKLREAARRAV
jgi:hypothetical protein